MQELVIKIPEEKLNIIKNKMYCGIYDSDLYEIIANGIVLPKGHGDLIDRKELLKLPIDKANYPSNYVKFAHTIIEADKESET